MNICKQFYAWNNRKVIRQSEKHNKLVPLYNSNNFFSDILFLHLLRENNRDRDILADASRGLCYFTPHSMTQSVVCLSIIATQNFFHFSIHFTMFIILHQFSVIRKTFMVCILLEWSGWNLNRQMFKFETDWKRQANC